MKPSYKIHKQLRREIALSSKVIRGSLVVMKRVCGKERCRCLKGHKHQSLYLSRSRKGTTQMRYIPKDSEIKVQEASMRYKRIINLLDQLSEIYIKELIIKRKR